MATVEAAYPFIEVKIDTSALMPVAQRSPGVIAIVGRGDGESGDNTVAANIPYRIDTLDDAKWKFVGHEDAADFIPTHVDASETKNIIYPPLYSSLKLALLQDPKPSKIYGVRVNGGNYAAALAALEAADDVTLVSLAFDENIDQNSWTGSYTALKNHVETMSNQGQRRIGVAMVDPRVQKATDYVTNVSGAATDLPNYNVNSLKSDSSRMVMVAARGAKATRPKKVVDSATGQLKTEEEEYVADVATAAMAAMAGYEPHISMVLKQVRGFKMPLQEQYSPTEIKALSEADIIPIIDPDLIVGEGLYFAEGRCFTTDSTKLYIDLVRTLDDIEFRLKAGLIGLVGDARITKFGMTRLKTQVEGILGRLKRRGVIANFAIDIPVLNVLNLPESAWNVADRRSVEEARENRLVEFQVDITYGPAVHRLKVTLVPKF